MKTTFTKVSAPTTPGRRHSTPFSLRPLVLAVGLLCCIAEYGSAAHIEVTITDPVSFEVFLKNTWADGVNDLHIRPVDDAPGIALPTPVPPWFQGVQTADDGVTLYTTDGHPTVNLNDEVGLDFRGFPVNARYEIWFTIDDRPTGAITRVLLTDAPEPYQDVYVVPEPASLALLGFGGLAAMRRRRSP